MSTERRRRVRGRSFVASFALVAGILAVVGIAGAAVDTARGPHVTSTQVDPAAAVEASGGRLIVTTSQSLDDVDPDQVTIEPSVPFAVDTSGRSVGVRFTRPLADDTEYTVSFRDVQGLGGGPAATFTHTFETPEAVLFLLQRGEESDVIWRTDLTGEAAVPVFEHEHIEDYRATARHLVVSVRDADGADLIVTDRAGGNERSLGLPDDGFVSNLQAADRGERIGYTFTDANIGAGGTHESVLFTSALSANAEPVQLTLRGADARVAQWRFVPDTDSILLLSFDGTLLLSDAEGASATTLGSALRIDGIAGTTAIVERVQGVDVVDLTDGSAVPLAGMDGEGMVGVIVPAPGGGTVRTLAQFDAEGLPVGVRAVFVTDDGDETTLLDIPPGDAVLQLCVSPNGRYAAVAVVPDAVSNPYGPSYELPLPARVETHIVEIADASPVVALTGAAVSWCRVPVS